VQEPCGGGRRVPVYCGHGSPHTRTGTAPVELTGTHHVSALSAHIRDSHAFHTRVMGLRPVLRTVNQDEPTMYHLFYGDGAGSPGSDLTIFDMPHAAPERRGNNSITLTTFRVNGQAALEYWRDRFADAGCVASDIHDRGGRAALEFDDPEGTRLCMIDDGGAGTAQPWADSPVPPEYQCRGLGYVQITVPDVTRTHEFLTAALGMRSVREYTLPDRAGSPVHVYEMGAGGVHAEVHVVLQPEAQPARYGAGAVHHLALRVPAMKQIGAWAVRLHDMGYPNSGVVDRHWFRSVYVREPNQVLFELATDGPGFDVDGPLDGQRLSLTPALEPRREEIEARLEPL
jgi:glyoxalase family protein